MRKKLIAFVMAVMVTFTVTGCNKPKDKGKVTYKGRYVEEEVSHNHQIGHISELYTENNMGTSVLKKSRAVMLPVSRAAS